MLKNYDVLDTGVIKQLDHNKFVYDENYIAVYKFGFHAVPFMSYLRYGYIIGTLGYVPDSILDIGYGDGSFLRISKHTIENCYGYDISGEKIPDRCEFLEYDEIFKRKFDIVTFFDSLEHMEEIDFLHKLDTRYILVTVPNCHNFSDEWFENWKHRKPDEHLYHFSGPALVAHLFKEGYRCVNLTNIEDTLRTSVDHNPNILTGIFEKFPE